MTAGKRNVSGDKDLPAAKRSKSTSISTTSDRQDIGFGRAPVPDEVMKQLTAPSLELNGFSVMTFVNVKAAKLFDAVQVIIFA